MDVVVEIDPQVVMNLVLVVDERVVQVVEVVVVAVEKVDPVGLPLVLLGTESPSPRVVEVQVVELQEAIDGPPIHLAVDFVQHHAELSHLQVLEQIVHIQKHHELGCAQLALSGNLTEATRFCCQDPCRGIWLSVGSCCPTPVGKQRARRRFQNAFWIGLPQNCPPQSR